MVDSWFDRNQGWVVRLGIVMAVQAILGIMCIEYAFMRLRRMRDVNEDRDAKFPAFRRLDAQNWSRLKLYPLAVLSMPYRLLFLIL